MASATVQGHLSLSLGLDLNLCHLAGSERGMSYSKLAEGEKPFGLHASVFV